jgi:hypothetical protein
MSSAGAFAQFPWPHVFTLAAFVLHITGGTIALFSGVTAAFATKGGPLHRAAGNVFFVSMLVMATFAIYLGIVMPGQLGNAFGGLFVLYLVTTAWLTVRRPENSIGLAEKVAFGVILFLFLPFAALSFALATGLGLPIHSAVPFRGPILIAFYVTTGVIAIAAASDARVVLTGGISGAARIARHLWRMCLGLLMATGSAFTNGLPRLLPGPMHVTGIYFLPMLLPLGLLIFWVIRVRMTEWFARHDAAALRVSQPAS